MIKFKGTKIELHKQFKTWCAINETNMQDKVIDLIEKLLKK